MKSKMVKSGKYFKEITTHMIKITRVEGTPEQDGYKSDFMVQEVSSKITKDGNKWIESIPMDEQYYNKRYNQKMVAFAGKTRDGNG